MFLEELALFVIFPTWSSHVTTYIFTSFLRKYNYLNTHHFWICYHIHKHMASNIISVVKLLLYWFLFPLHLHCHWHWLLFRFWFKFHFFITKSVSSITWNMLCWGFLFIYLCYYIMYFYIQIFYQIDHWEFYNFQGNCLN